MSTKTTLWPNGYVLMRCYTHCSISYSRHLQLSQHTEYSRWNCWKYFTKFNSWTVHHSSNWG